MRLSMVKIDDGGAIFTTLLDLAANEHMTGGAGVDGIIHRAAGGRLREECYLHRQVEPGVRLPTGRSRILLSYNLSSNTSYIINTAGPVYDSYEKERCAEELESCYKTALALANLYDLTSIAFPAISCGIFGYVSVEHPPPFSPSTFDAQRIDHV